MVDILRGRWPSHKELPTQVAEMLLANQTGWSLREIRNLEKKDFEIFAKLSILINNFKDQGE